MKVVPTIAAVLWSVVAVAGQAAGLDDEINALGSEFRSRRDVAVFIERGLMTELGEQWARASARDLQIRLLPGRLMASRSDLGFAKYDNFLDIDGGEGFVDLREARVEGVADGRIQLLVDMAGRVVARARGKQIGFNYRANPEIGVNLRDRVGLILEPGPGGYRLRPAAKQLVAKLAIGVNIAALGTRLSAAEELPVDMAGLMPPVALPATLDPKLGGSSPVFRDLAYSAEQGRLRVEADLAILPATRQ